MGCGFRHCDPFSQPGILTIPVGFGVLVAVSLLTRRSKTPGPAVVSAES
jgi:hypothetical protein